jgi:uncharacterized membrane protein YkoI
MKIALVIIIAGFCLFPSRGAQANDALNSALNSASSSAVIAANSKSRQENKVKSRKQATQMVKQKYKAKVLSVQLTEVDRKSVYVAKLLGNDGVVFYVYVDARSGQMRRR